VQILILSDIHANWPALETVLRDAEGDYQSMVCCGDLVGYNPYPSRVVQWVRDSSIPVIRGNHDKVVAGLEGLEWFNEVAQISARWTMEQLDGDQMQFLRDLPQGPAVLDGFEIWHGSPADEDEYLTAPAEATPCFETMEVPLGFFGHTHLQGGFFSKYGRVGKIRQVPHGQRESVLELEPDVLYMVNPGSVGQPRDRDARAAYAIYDDAAKTVTYRRVEYPVQETARQIKEAGLPDVLGFRLMVGF
jgi:predicted phosphodiesterase